MTENQNNSNKLLDTTDCLEAIGVFRGWKNFLFIIIVCSLVLLQIAFWLVDTGLVATTVVTKQPASAVIETVEIEKPAAEVNPATPEPNLSVTAISPSPADQPNEAAKPESRKPIFSVSYIKFKHLAGLIRFFNFILIPTAILYCLTMLFSLKVSLLGRLGGISHISRAFFLSLTFVVLLLPWQKFFAGVVTGAMFTAQELLDQCCVKGQRGIIDCILYYARFSGYWTVVTLLLICSQLRSGRWSKAILRRLEVI